MNRRRVLALTTASVPAAWAGCLGDDDGNGDDDGDDGGDGDPNPTDEAAPQSGSGTLTIGEESWSFTVESCSREGEVEGEFRLIGRTDSGFEVNVSRRPSPLGGDELIDAVSLYDPDGESPSVHWQVTSTRSEAFLTFDDDVVRATADFRDVTDGGDDRTEGTLAATCP